MKGRGNTVSNPAGTKYPFSAWVKGYAAWLLVLPLYLGLWAFAKCFKRVPNWMLRKLLREWQRETNTRPQDVRIPTNPGISPYMLRWWRIKRNAFFNVYYHLVLRSDDDTALHDHPWWNFSIVLEGGYYEHRILNGGVHAKTWYGPGAVLFRRSGDYAHRLELVAGFEINPEIPDEWKELPAKTIFITGPVLRRWGFHHPEKWVDAYAWDEFCAERGIGGDKMAGYAEQLKKGN
jgi:hypothetical protein